MQNTAGKIKVKYMTKIAKVEGLEPELAKNLEEVTEKFKFRSNDYYNSLIDWNDPDDPIRKIVIPEMDELNEFGKLDASNEHKYTKAQGLEHKYPDTALILMNDICGAYCRFCFRKRLFQDGNDDTVNDLSEAFDYIREHKEITNVLLTGGDPLIVSTGKLEKVIAEIRKIEHVNIIRIGSKILPFNPHRVIDDLELPIMLQRYSTPTKKIYIMNHFNHPREITPEAIEAINILHQHGIPIVNQTPMIKGVNDNVEVLVELLNKLSFLGVPPYYIFQCRPTEGNENYSVKLEEASRIFNEAISKVSGLGARCRFVMSDESGKIEILGKLEDKMVFKYHRASEERLRGKLFTLPENPDANWFCDYEGFDNV